MISLRWYQDEAIRSIYSYYGSGKTGHALIALPTGTGKSLVIGEFIRRVLQEWPMQRFLALTHVKELIEQDKKALLQVWPSAPYGIYSAGLKSRDVLHPIVYGGIASVHKAAYMFGHRDIIVIDEAHLISPNANTMYRRVIDELTAINPKLKVIGLTATPFRLGQGMLTDDGLFNDVVYNLCDPDGFARLISEGFLAPVVPRHTETALNTQGVAINNGEFVLSQLQDAVNVPAVTQAALREVYHYGQDRRSWLIFCSGIEHAENCAMMLNAMGVPCGVVHSKMSDGERDRTIDAYRSGELRAITNNNVLTTGFDHPATDLIAMLRPTMSPGLWVQMLGRGTRPAPGKHNCLVLDFARNTVRLGPIDDPRIPGRPGVGTGEVPVKLCPSCGAYNHPRVVYCICCGHKFEFEQKLVKQADTAPLMSFEQPIVETFPVWSVIYSRHVGKASGKTSVRVTYYTPNGKFSEYLSFDAVGYALHAAHEWWRKHMTTDVPLSSDMALAQINGSRQPARIRVWTNTKYPRIMGYEF